MFSTPSQLDRSGHWQRIAAADSYLPVASELLFVATGHQRVAEFFEQVLGRIHAQLAANWIAVVRPRRGDWSVFAEHGTATALPTTLLADALDTEQSVADEDWLVIPLAAQSSSQELLVINGSDIDPVVADAIAAALSVSIETIRSRNHDARRVRRLETILRITNEWNKTRETEPLLCQMAEAATKLIGADRASIFLWDRDNKMLVGRPALGVEGGELRIPDDTGIVGQVLQSGEPRRVDRKGDQDQIDRKVDEQLGYTTKTLLCVPLRSSTGELFGAFEMINKLEGNFNDEDEAGLVELAAHAATALENTQELEQLIRLNRQLVNDAADAVRLIGESPTMEQLRSTIKRVADTDLAVMILGENGTGKEVVSQMIHYLSGRRDQPFIAINCAAIPETLLESELFGHEKGAFTDAQETRIGKFELAATGTLFLDEIGDLSLSGQSKLLRVLEEKVVVRVGGSTPIHTDARVIAATNQNLSEMVQAKTFREDLYFRLNVVTLELPPLRDRGDDIILLAEHFLVEFARKANRKAPKLMASARKRLRGHSWPGNIRELRNLTERLVYLSSSEKIEADDLEFILSPQAGSASHVEDDLPLSDATTRFQEQYIDRAIERCSGNMSEAASRLGLHRSNLYRKMRQLDMRTDEE